MTNALLLVFGIALLLGAVLTPRVPLWCRVAAVLLAGGGLLNHTRAEGYFFGLAMMGMGVFLGGILASGAAEKAPAPDGRHLAGP